jgi:hypothetical protein
MKNSTVLTVVVAWFTVLSAVALGMASPEMFTQSGMTNISGHGVSSSISTLTSIICTAVPFVAMAITLTVSYVWHKESSKDKAVA